METRTCQNCKINFNIEPDDFLFYEKIKVPPPTFCPECRFQRRLAFRNNRVFYRQKCAKCNQFTLSLYNPDSVFTIYCRECWLSDKWNPVDYGKEYDFAIPFLSQFRSLQYKVPRQNLYRDNFVNSDYCNYGLDFKDCYLLFGGKLNERVYFGNQVIDSRDSFDVAFSEKLEFSYDIFECSRANKLFFSSYSIDCVDSSYLINCRNCMNCFGCINLVNKQYCIFNKQYTRDEYQKLTEDLNVSSYSSHLKILKQLNSLNLTIPHRYSRIYKSLNSTGDDLYEAKNSYSCFSSREVEDSKYLFFCRNKSKDCYDTSFQGFNAELIYEVAHGFAGSGTAFSLRNLDNQNVYYSEECHNCSNLFGCEGLRKKSYCILNKQYTKEKYEELMPKIIKHMNDVPYIDSKGRVYKYGEFFPIELSPFAYNETIAQEYYPLTKEEALEQGYKWKDKEERNYNIDIYTNDIPDDIKNISEDIIDKVIECAHKDCNHQCTEAFKIIEAEFQFYKRMNLPLPRLCPNCRHYERLAQRNPMKLYHRKCMKEGCNNEFETSYAPDRPEIIYCERCYQNEVY